MKEYPEGEYLKISEAAQRAGVTVMTLHRWIADGLPAYRQRTVRGFLVRADELEIWLAPRPVADGAAT